MTHVEIYILFCLSFTVETYNSKAFKGVSPCFLFNVKSLQKSKDNKFSVGEMSKGKTMRMLQKVLMDKLYQCSKVGSLLLLSDKEKE